MELLKDLVSQFLMSGHAATLQLLANGRGKRVETVIREPTNRYYAEIHFCPNEREPMVFYREI